MDLSQSPPPEPTAGKIVNTIVTLSAITTISCFIYKRCLGVRSWRRVSFVPWLVLAIFLDSYIFVWSTAVLHYGIGISANLATCSAAIILCLALYITTKVMIYLFLVERCFTVRSDARSRLKSKLYIFNSFGMLSVYFAVGVLNFIFRITYMKDGECVIGMQRVSVIPLITFDVIVNVYLTTLFIVPLRRLYSFNGNVASPGNPRLRVMALRAFVGGIFTTSSSIANLTILMIFDGEPGWVCFLCCNCDVLLSSVVLHWVTSPDTAQTVQARPPLSTVATADNIHNVNNGNNGNHPFRRMRPSSTNEAETGSAVMMGVVGVRDHQHDRDHDRDDRSVAYAGSTIDETSSENLSKETTETVTEIRHVDDIEMPAKIRRN